MKERREKENKGVAAAARRSASLFPPAPTNTMDAPDVFGTPGAPQGAQLMLSPPPEEELRTLASPTRRAVRGYRGSPFVMKY